MSGPALVETLASAARWQTFVAGCGWIDEPDGRREERRQVVSSQAALATVEGDSTGPHMVRIVNVSKRGVEFDYPIAVAVKARARLQIRPGTPSSLLVAGSVVHCTPSSGRYRIGLQLEFPR